MSIYQSQNEWENLNKSLSEIFGLEYQSTPYEKPDIQPFSDKTCCGENNGYYGKSHTQEYKQERSKLMLGNSHSKGHIKTPETIEKHRISRMGYHHDEETKRKIGNGNKGKRKGQAITEEWRQNILNSCGSKKVMGPDGTIYDSIKGAARLLNTSPQTIKNRAKKQLFGWKFVEV